MRRRLGFARPAVVIVLTLCLGACSLGTRLAYNNLDWLAQGWLEDYFSLDDGQQAAFDAAFTRWWLWHRHTQLPAYATTLRDWADAVRGGLEEADLAEARQRMRGHFHAAMEHSYPEFALQLSRISDSQLADLLAEYDRGTEDYRESIEEGTAEKRRKRRLKRTRRTFESFLGRLNPEQRQVLEDWADQREDLSAQWLQSRRKWRQAFARLMQQRSDEEFAQALRPLILEPQRRWSESLSSAVQRNAQARERMLLRVLDLASPRQLERLDEELRRLAQLCDDLAESGAPNESS